MQDDAGSQHSQESESGSNESSYDSEAESDSDSAEGTEAAGTSEDGSNGAVSLEVSIRTYRNMLLSVMLTMNRAVLAHLL